MAEVEDRRELALREELSLVSRRSFERHLISGSGGNISARIPGSDRVLVTASGVSLADVAAGNIILCHLDGTILAAPGGLRPSKETEFHLAVYRLKPEVMALVHVHPPFATAYSNTGADLPMSTVSAQGKLGHVPCIESAPPGSPVLRELVVAGVEKHPGAVALLMKAHGILTMGEDLRAAYYLADLLEDTARIAFLTQAIKNEA